LLIVLCAPTITGAAGVFVATGGARSRSLAAAAAAAATATARPADELKNMGALLGFWSVGVL
jgi:hypothetical protein